MHFTGKLRRQGGVDSLYRQRDYRACVFGRRCLPAARRQYGECARGDGERYEPGSKRSGGAAITMSHGTLLKLTISIGTATAGVSYRQAASRPGVASKFVIAF
jgi:hypothetical protein